MTSVVAVFVSSVVTISVTEAVSCDVISKVVENVKSVVNVAVTRSVSVVGISNVTNNVSISVAVVDDEDLAVDVPSIVKVLVISVVTVFVKIVVKRLGVLVTISAVSLVT